MSSTFYRKITIISFIAIFSFRLFYRSCLACKSLTVGNLYHGISGPLIFPNIIHEYAAQSAIPHQLSVRGKWRRSACMACGIPNQSVQSQFGMSPTQSQATDQLLGGAWFSALICSPNSPRHGPTAWKMWPHLVVIRNLLVDISCVYSLSIVP